MRKMHIIFKVTANQTIAKETAFLDLIQPREKMHFIFQATVNQSIIDSSAFFSISKSLEKRPASPPTLQDDPVPPVPAVPLTFPVPLTLPAGEPYSPFPVHLRTTFAGELQSESDIGSFSPV